MRIPAPLISLIIALAASAASPQTWAERAGDDPLSGPDLAAAIVGQTLVFFDNGQSRFFVEGEYTYTYFEGGTALGKYQILDDGQVCIDFRNGFTRCDRYVRNGGRLVMLDENGDRYPIR